MNILSGELRKFSYLRGTWGHPLVPYPEGTAMKNKKTRSF